MGGWNHKNFFGFKIFPRSWSSTISGVLKSTGFQPGDPSNHIYIHLLLEIFQAKSKRFPHPAETGTLWYHWWLNKPRTWVDGGNQMVFEWICVLLCLHRACAWTVERGILVDDRMELNFHRVKEGNQFPPHSAGRPVFPGSKMFQDVPSNDVLPHVRYI